MEPNTISIKEKSDDYISLLGDRSISIELIIAKCHDGDGIVDGIAQINIIEYLLEKKEISYEDAKEYFKKNIGYKESLNPDEMPMWMKPVINAFDKTWLYISKLSTLDIPQAKELFERGIQINQ